MEEDIKKYITLLEASKLCSYSQGYLSLRARQGKLQSIKIGKNWHTTEEWIKEYIKAVESYKVESYKVEEEKIEIQNQETKKEKLEFNLICDIQQAIQNLWNKIPKFNHGLTITQIFASVLFLCLVLSPVYAKYQNQLSNLLTNNLFSDNADIFNYTLSFYPHKLNDSVRYLYKDTKVLALYDHSVMLAEAGIQHLDSENENLKKQFADNVWIPASLPAVATALQAGAGMTRGLSRTIETTASISSSLNLSKNYLIKLTENTKNYLANLKDKFLALFIRKEIQIVKETIVKEVPSFLSQPTDKQTIVEKVTEITSVIPSLTGNPETSSTWIPAFAGMTNLLASTKADLESQILTSKNYLLNEIVSRYMSVPNYGIGFKVDELSKLTITDNGLIIEDGQFLFSSNGMIKQTGTGQVVFAGNVDANNGLDIKNANLTVGTDKFTVDYSNGNTVIGGTATITGTTTLSSIVASGPLTITSLENSYITGGGYFGLGTTTPNWNLQVAGTRPFIVLSDTGAGTNDKHWYMSSEGGNFYLGTSTDALNATSTYLSINSKGDLAVDNNTFYVDALNNRVGLGTSSPSQLFSVNGHAYVTGGLGVGVATSTNGVIETSGNVLVGGNLIVKGQSTSTSSYAAGALGIGTSSPYALLSVNTSLGIPSFAIGSSTNTHFLVDANGSVGIGTSSPLAILSVYNPLSTDKTLFIVGTSTNTSFIINTNGYIGLGTSSPSQLFSANGHAYITGGLGVGVSTSTNGVLQTSGNAQIGNNLYVNGTAMFNTVTAGSWQGTAVGTEWGGTGQNWSATVAGSLPYFSGTGAMSTLTPGLTNGLLSYSGSAPQWVSTSSLGLLASSTIANLSANYLSKWSGSFFSNSLFYDDGTYAGVGTTTPRYKLTINASDGTTNLFQVSTTTNQSIAIIDNQGRFGLGTSSPSQLFSANGHAYFTGGLGIGVSTTTNGTLQTSNNIYSSGNLYIAGQATSTNLYVSSKVGIGTSTPTATFSVNAEANTPRFMVGSTTATGANVSTFLIDKAGNVGIGKTTGINYLLDVNGIIYSASTVYASAFMGPLFTTSDDNTALTIQHRDFSTVNLTTVSMGTGTHSETTGTTTIVAIKPIYNQVGSTATSTDLLINRTETSLGSGSQRLIDAGTGGSVYDSKFFVTNIGNGYFKGKVGVGTTTPYGLLSVDSANDTSIPTMVLKQGMNQTTDLLQIRAALSQVGSSTQDILLSVDAYGGVNQSIGSTTLKIKAVLTDATNLNTAYGIYIQGKYAYVTAISGNRLVVVDIATTTPRIIGVLNDATNLNNPYGIYVSGKYAYVTALLGNRLTIIDISNPSAPTIAGSLNDATNLNGPFGVYVSGKYAYVTAIGVNRLTIIDISNPSAPTIAGSLNDATNLNDPRCVYISGKYAYVTALSGNRLTIIDISNPSAPTIAGSLNDATNLNDPFGVYVSGKYAYVTATLSNCLIAVDVSNPAQPFIVSKLRDDTNLLYPYNIYVSGKYAYVAAYSGNRLTIINLGGFDIPTASIGNLETNYLSVTDNADFANNLFVRNGLNVGTGGIYSQGTSSFPSITTTSKVGIGTSSPYGLLSVDSANDTSIPTMVLKQGTGQTTDLMQIRSAVASDGGTGSNNGNDILLSVDAYGGVNQNIGSTTMRIKASLQDWTNLNAPRGIYISGKYAYVAASSGNRLSIVDVATTMPKVVGVLNDDTNLNFPYGVFVSGKYAYVTAYIGNRLTVVDISNPSAPIIAGVLNDATNLYGVRNIYVSGKYAYVAPSALSRLTIVDISNPSSLAVAGVLSDVTNLNGPYSVYVSGKYAYVTVYDGNRLTIVDISNPNIPTIASSLNDATNLNGPYGVYVSGKYAYVTTRNGNRLTIVDISNPSAPIIAGVLFDATNLNNPTGVSVSGKYAYVTAYAGNRLTAVDISNPARPFIASVLIDATNLNVPYNIFVSGQYAYVIAYGVSLLTIIDLGGMDIPTASIGNLETNYLSVTDNADFGNNLFVRNGLNVGTGGIYSQGTSSFPSITTTSKVGVGTSSPYGLLSVDSAGDTSIPTMVLKQGANQTTDLMQIRSAVASDSALGANLGNDIFLSVDAYGGVNQNIGSTTMRIKAVLTDTSNLAASAGIYVQGKYAYVAAYSSNRLTIIDIATTTPKVVGTINDATNLAGISRVAVSGKYAYVTAQTNSVFSIIDVSNPVSPKLISSITDATNLPNVTGISISGKYAYMGTLNDTSGRFAVIDISNPYSPSITASIADATNFNNMYHMAISGRYAYVTSYTNSKLNIIDISNPASPVVVSSFSDATNASIPLGISVSGKYAYIACQSGRLAIIDISNPTSPVLVGSLLDNTNLNLAWGIAVSGKYAYVTGYGKTRISAIDISNPASPFIASILIDTTNLNSPIGITVSGKYAYVANYTGNSLTIVDLGGMDIPTASIGNLETNYLSVTDNADFGNNLFVRNGLNVGTGGIYSQGTSSVLALTVPNGAICADNGGTTKCYGSLLSGTVYGDVGSFALSDLAENYWTDDNTIEAGDIVAINATADWIPASLPAVATALQAGAGMTEGIFQSAPLIKADIDNNSVIGIISTAPGVLMGDLTGYPDEIRNKLRPVALSGRVPIKVSNENGDIQAGDRLTLSDTMPGRAMKMTESGQSIGIALESFDESRIMNHELGTGTILAFVNLSYQKLTDPSDLANSLNVSAITSISGKWSVDEEGVLTARKIVANELKTKRIKTNNLEVKDKATGDIYCIYIENGNWAKTIGECQ